MFVHWRGDFDDSGFVADDAAREYEGFAERVIITEGEGALVSSWANDGDLLATYKGADAGGRSGVLSKILGGRASEMGIEILAIMPGSTLTSVQLFLSASQGAIGGVR